MIEFIRDKDHLTIRIEQVESIFEIEFFEKFRSSFEQLLADLDQKKISVASIILVGSYSDYTEVSRALINEKLELPQFSERLTFYRLLCRMIQNSSILWRFFASDNCLGAMWEIALSCHQRYWSNPNAYVGVSEIRENIFPGLGVYETFVRENKISRAELQTHYKQTAQDMHRKGYIKLLPESKFWQDYATTQSLIDVSKTPPKKGEEFVWKDLPAKAYIANRNTLNQRENEVDDALKAQKKTNISLTELFDKLKEKKRPEDDKIVLNYCNQIFAAKNIHWLFRRSSHLEFETNPKAPLRRTTLYVDIEETIPPTSCLKSLLQGNYHLVFFNENLEILKKSLEIVYSRLEAELGLDMVQDYFSVAIDWVNCHPNRKRQLVAKWGLGGGFQIIYSGQVINYFRTSGNHSFAKLGWYERQDQVPGNLVAKVMELEGALAFGIIPMDGPDRKIHVHHIRSLFWSEILFCGLTLASLSPTKVIAVLKKFGWDFAGDEHAWSQFLKNRFDMNSDFEPLKPFCRDRFFEKSLHSITIEEFPGLLKIREKVNATYSESMLHHHLMCFSALLSKFLLKQKLIENSLKADVLVAQAVGFPRIHGTPTFLADTVGIPAVLYHLNQTGLNLSEVFKQM